MKNSTANVPGRKSFQALLVATHIAEGRPYQEIVKLAARIEADLDLGSPGFAARYCRRVAERVGRRTLFPIAALQDVYVFRKV